MSKRTMVHLSSTAGLAAVVIATAGLAGCSHSQKQKQDQNLNVNLMREYSPVATTVEVSLERDGIGMPEVIGSGWTNFVVRNLDAVSHVFIIRGQGIERMLPGRVEPGDMQTLRVELKPGTYEVICPDCGPGLAEVKRKLTVAEW